MRYLDIIYTKSNSVYSIVREVPKSRVVTYGAVAKKAGVTPRMVGRALHQNPDPQKIPCHRVVNRQGRVAENYAFGGAKAQRRRLLSEGITFIDDKHVDLKACLWQP